MTGRTRVLRGMTVRRVVTAVCTAAFLTGSQVHPSPADLHALLAFVPLRLLDGRDRRDVRAGFVGHESTLSRVVALTDAVPETTSSCSRADSTSRPSGRLHVARAFLALRVRNRRSEE